MTERHGIAGIGTFIIDHVRMIDSWPEEQTLATISNEEFSGGGMAHNLVVDIAHFDLGIPIEAVGFVGDDDDGRSILNLCQRLGIDTTNLHTSHDAPTSYTEVMTVESSGKRTFFHSRGANKLVTYDTVPFDTIKSKIGALGYLLLMDGIDAPDEEFGTVAAKILNRLQLEGIRTAIDTVSEDSDRLSKIVPPALKYTDYVILNEFEAGKITGHTILDGEALDSEALRASAKQLQGYGNSELVVIHMHIGAYALKQDGEEIFQPSLLLPEDYIVGGAGAGDAFYNGVLCGLHEGWPLEEGMRFGTCAAAACMSHPTCTEGVPGKEECLKIEGRFSYRESALK
ncbi:MAG: carbohydrate kinase family protein [Candidatus Hydrogenedentota bacterium]